MSHPHYGSSGSADDGSPEINPNTGLPEPQYSPDAPSYGEASQHGEAQTAANGSQPGIGDHYGNDPYQAGQYSGGHYGSGQYGSQPGQYGGDQYSSDPYGTSAAASYGSQPGGYGSAPQFAAMGGAGTAQDESDKSFVVTWLLGWLLGSFGADRFYLGKIGTAIAKLVTGGGFGIWALIDLIMHLVGATRDTQGRRLAGYDRNKKMAWIVTIAAWLLSLILSIIIVVVIAMSGVFNVNAPPDRGTDPGTSQQTDAPQAGEGSGDTGESDDSGDSPTSEDVTAWAESTYGTFDPVTVEGSGDQTVPVPDGVGAAIVELDTSADRVRASAKNADGEIAGNLYLSGAPDQQQVGDIGMYDYDDTAQIQVEGDGDWALIFSPISSAPALPESGSGSGLFLYDGAGGSAGLEYTGERNFIVHQLGEGTPTLLANEIDAWSGTVELEPGPSVIRVFAYGDWTFTPA